MPPAPATAGVDCRGMKRLRDMLTGKLMDNAHGCIKFLTTYICRKHPPNNDILIAFTDKNYPCGKCTE